MRHFYICLLISLFTLTFSTSCKTGSQNSQKPDESWLNNDFKPDPFYPGGQVEIQIPSSGSSMYGLVYTANGKGPHPTVVLLHGLPGHERNLDVAQSLRRAGYNVLYFTYRGSWGSKGTFGFQNAIEDATAVIDYLTDPENSAELRVDTTKIVFYGHSMGAGISLLTGLKDERIKGVIGTSVFNPYTLLQGDAARGTLISLKEYLLTLGMLNCNPNRFLNDILRNIDQYDIEKSISQSSKPILIIDEHMNNIDFTKFNKLPNVTFKIWNTDQAFSNRRIALTKEVKNWLDKVVGQKELEKEE